MNISGIRPNEGFYDYNYIKSEELRTQQIQSVNRDLNTPAQENGQQENLTSTSIAAGAISQDFGSYDYAQLYQPDATYELKGADSNIRSLDMEQAISDMQKDQVLQQYQFFVGETVGADVGTAFAARGMENFSL